MNRGIQYTFSFIILILFLFACGGNSSQVTHEKCATKPVPIFSDTMKLVQKHSFEAKGTNSHEEAILSDTIKIELLQSGCDMVRREFRITRKGNFKQQEDDFWIRGAVETLGYLANESPQLYGLNQFASMIAASRKVEDFRFGQPFSPDPMFSIILDKIVNEQEGKVIVVLEDKGL